MKNKNTKFTHIAVLMVIFPLTLITACNSIQTTSKDEVLMTKGIPVVTQQGVERNYMVTGTASMKRLPSGSNGTTIANLHVKGLHPNEKYPTHVHNLPCRQKSGGGHYQNERGGKVDNINEIWLTFTTDAMGNGSSEARHGYVARPDAQSIVIHDSTPDKARIACIDLK